MRVVGAIAGALLALAFAGQPALADKRIALVIGNSAYRNVAKLPNPINDASAIAATFRKANFDTVDSRNDLAIADMRKVLREFSAKARDADVAVIYYAGHGIEVDGINYMIPVDAQLEADTDVYDETVSLERVLVAVEPAKQLRLIILDACRDNPFARSMKRTIASRAIGRGLAKVEPNNPNTMIAFAAKAGFVASDGGANAKNSPFATALVDHLTRPGLDLRKAFGFVRDDVLKATNNKQEPFIYGSLGGNDVALVPAVAAPAVAADSDAAARRDYELAAQVGTREGWDTFLSTYASGFYANLARAQRNKLVAEEARQAAAEKARLATEEKARLEAENAKASELAKAAREARAAEEARVAAEKKKAAEEAKLAEVERAKAAVQAKAEEAARVAAEKAKAEADAKAAREAKAAEEARVAEEKRKAAEEAKRAEAEAKERAKEAKEDKPVGQLAALAPSGDPASPPGVAAGDIPKRLLVELKRVGCNNGAVDGEWNPAAQRSLALFNKHAGLKLDVKVASIDALDAVKSKAGRICPLVCERGYRAEGDSCVKITCKPGYQVGDGNSCEKIEPRKPIATREAPAEAPQKRPEAKPAPSAKGADAGKIICNQQGCREIKVGCRIGRAREGSSFGSGQREVCN